MNDGIQISRTTAPQFEEYSAFTVAELGDMMKEVDEEMPWWVNGSWWYWGKIEKGKSKGRNIEIEVPTNEADARAKMLIYLLENNLINYDHKS